MSRKRVLDRKRFLYLRVIRRMADVCSSPANCEDVKKKKRLESKYYNIRYNHKIVIVTRNIVWGSTAEKFPSTESINYWHRIRDSFFLGTLSRWFSQTTGTPSSVYIIMILFQRKKTRTRPRFISRIITLWRVQVLWEVCTTERRIFGLKNREVWKTYSLATCLISVLNFSRLI